MTDDNDTCLHCGLPGIECFDYGCSQNGCEPDCAQCALESKPLRLRVDLTSTTGPPWLTLLALCGWLRGVVDIPELEA